MFGKLLVFLFSLGLGSLSAQSFSGKINPYPLNLPLDISLQDTVKILAVMADFPVDNDGSTFGNGKFGSLYSRDYGTGIIDPLPHDINYFSNHLLFIKNYFSKVSGQKVNITYQILPDVITVSRTMRNYSPPPGSEDLSPVAEFAKEVWTKADSAYPEFQFGGYDVFLILHAGAGRDITLPGSLGNERDLPSVYFSPAAFTKLIPGFTGFPAGPDDFRIMNSAIIPETESRELSSFGTTMLFELSINGLLAATFASYLGLPDLFDTETGLSAIGRFGLMDGQAIFAYNGLFPPEPSAWEKIFLGWKVPSEASINIENYNLAASQTAGSDTSILKVNLTSSEYYLLENRQRDVNSNGSVVTYISEGETKTRTFIKDTTGFYSYDIDSLEGVIIDVDEFDWALPGNGILIWHIDNNIIENKITENKINNDINKRGVDVEEADGIQDIGVEFQTIFGDVVIGEGEQRDMWFSTNDADLYKNRFAKDTRPDTKTNTGANSLITISDFSDLSNKMSFRIAFGDSIIKPVSVSKISLPEGDVSLTHTGNRFFGFSAGNTFIIRDNSGVLVDSLSSFSMYKPASFVSGDTTLFTGSGDSLNIFVLSTAAPAAGVMRNFPYRITSNTVILNEQRKIIAGTLSKIVIISFTGLPDLYSVDSLVFQNTGSIYNIASDGDYIAATAHNGLASIDPPFGHNLSEYIFIDNNSVTLELDVTPTDLLLTKNSDGEYISIVVSDSKILIIKNGTIISAIEKEHISKTGAALTDLKQDGNNYIAFNDGSSLKVYNLNGFPADNFPYTDLNNNFDPFVLSADFEGDNASEIIAATSDGRIFAFDGRTGRIVDGFPISAGKKLKANPLLFNDQQNTFLSVIDTLNNFYIWNISSVPGKLYWYEEYGNPGNTSFSGAPLKDNFVNTFFPSNRVYNYPNPAYDNKTYIRYYVSENSKINIKIFDLAGALVDELNADAAGGSDNETEWNLNSVQSGIYLARIEASGTGGKKEVNIIKIAVVK